MRRTFWLRRKQRSKLDAIIALRRVGKMRGSPLGDDVVPAGRLVIMRALVRIL
jgi:hypothetical protein